MPLHPQAEQFLAQQRRLNQPPLETIPLDVTRKAQRAGYGPAPDCPPLARIEDRTLAVAGGTIRLRCYTPRGAGPYGACLYFHGGGWVINDIDTHDDLVRRLAAASGCVCVSVDYRLAPEHRYPTAAEDSYAALQWTAAHAAELHVDPRRLAVAGDSAGGNLAAALCLMTRDRGGPPLQFQALIYPIVDCDLNRPSYLENADGYFLTRAQMQWFWESYCPDPARRSEPYAAPLRAPSLAGLPPALILTAEYDPLRDEGAAYAAALTAAGVPAEHVDYAGLIHAFVRRVETFAAAHDAISRIGAALQRTIGAPA